MTTRTTLLTAAALCAALAAPSTAAADKTFRGKSSQDRTVNVTTGDDNVLKTFRINWFTRKCAQSGSRFQNITTFKPPFDEAVADKFTDGGSFTVADRGAIRSRVTMSVAGQRTADSAGVEKWTGTAKATVVVRRRGKVIDRCRLRQITWSATAS